MTLENETAVHSAQRYNIYLSLLNTYLATKLSMFKKFKNYVRKVIPLSRCIRRFKISVCKLTRLNEAIPNRCSVMGKIRSWERSKLHYST